MKKWVIKSNGKRDTKIECDNLINDLLLSRGMDTRDKANGFFYPKIEGTYDPYLLKDMNRAIEKIDAIIKKRKKIVIYGDYDVDGITSTSILYCALKKIGVDVGYYIPDRINEGYGINKDAIGYIKCLQTDMIITVDCGVTSIEEVEYAKQLGMDIIVTDHHECKEKIPDTIVINPKRKDCSYPFKNLAGCGVAFKLVQALWMKYGLIGVEDFLDIAAIGTIADVVDLVEENRIIVSYGLELMQKSDKCGIRAIKAVASIRDKISANSIAFQIAPRINAAGRLSDAKIAVELFTTNDYDKALQIAKYLDQENKNRQKIEKDMLNEALDKIYREVDLKNDRVIVVSSPNWHIGVVDIVALKIVEKFTRPTILICEEGNVGRGSGRSIEGINLFNSLYECSSLLLKFRGYEMAAGLLIDISKIDELRKRLNSIAQNISSEYFLNTLYIDMECKNEDVNLKTADMLKLFEPYGSGNLEPVFLISGLSVVSKEAIGDKQQHLKLSFGKDEYKYDGIMYNGSNEYLNRELNYVDVVFTMSINDWNNKKNVQLMLKDMKPNIEWLDKKLQGTYYKTFKHVINDRIEKFDFKGIKFIQRDMEFLKKFAYFNRGYILVSSKKSLYELSPLFNTIEVNMCKNTGNTAQIIVNPDVHNIKLYNNDIMIFDFLPGEYEYSILRKKTNGLIYNFYNDETFSYIDKYMEEFIIKEENVMDVYNDLICNEVVGTIDEIAKRYNINSYKIYRIINYLKSKNKINVIQRDEILKLNINDSKEALDLNLVFQEKYIMKANNLKQKLHDLLEEE